MALDPAAWTGMISGLGAVGVLVYDKVSEKRKTRAKGLDPNPERCEKHEIRLAVIEEKLSSMALDIKELKDRK